MDIMEMAPTRGIPSPRANKLKEQLLASPFDIDLARVRAYTRIWGEMGADGDRTPCMRAARAFAETLRGIDIFIGDEERLVGTRGAYLRSENIGVERFNCFSSYDMAISIMTARKHIKRVSDKSRSELENELLPFWKGKTAFHFIARRFKEERIIEKSRPLGPVDTYRLFKGVGGFDKALSLLKKLPALITAHDQAEDEVESVQSLSGVHSRTGGVARRSVTNLKNLARLGLSFAKYGEIMVHDSLWLQAPLQGHLVPGYPRVLELGFQGIAERARQGLEELKEGDEDYLRRKEFYESVIISADAVCDYSLRYAELAERKAAEAATEERKSELLETAERCRRVPARPPESFMEALQSILITGTVMIISYGVDNIFSPGRVDQYLYPCYKKDIESGQITRDQALEALEEYLIKLSAHTVFGPNQITIGGLDKEGNDATNEVSFLLLEALENIRGMGDGLAVRISGKTPHEFLLRSCAVNQYTAGVAFYNDDIVIRDLMDDGYSLEDARNYSVVGCVEPEGTGDSYSSTALNGFWPIGVLELALNGGRRLITGSRRVGVDTPDPRQFGSFEDVKDAFEKQLSFVIEKSVRMKEVTDRVFADFFPNPLLSSTIEGCLESGLDATRGGARYNHGCVNAQALGTMTDSLAAIRWAVFDEKIVSMDELLKALSVNFKGYDSLRQTLLRKAPKYGNDDPRADEIAAWISEIFTREGGKHTSWRGGRYRCSMVSSATQVLEGWFCGATPDGRLALEPVSNGMSPSNGMELSGPTATLRSAALAGDVNYSDGSALNMRVSPLALKSEENLEKFASLLEAYFIMGGRHVQFNPLDAATLRDAQAHPEKYPDLTVKVSGYSARFAEIVKALQDDIIARTEFEEL
jgi:pyruvate formate-lyase/glycerol dehydratase family glycyl radical enzyme